MATKVGTVYIDIQLGPNVQLLVDLLEVVDTALDLVPEWNQYEKAQIEERAHSLRAELAETIDADVY